MGKQKGKRVSRDSNNLDRMAAAASIGSFAISFLMLFLILAGPITSLTTIENTTDDGTETVAPELAWTYINGDGTEITDLSSATIFGIVTFRADITNDPYPHIESFRMYVHTMNTDGSKGSGVVNGLTMQYTNGGFEVEWDTTTVEDGEYIIEFEYTLDTGYTRVPMSLVFSKLANEGSLGNNDTDDDSDSGQAVFGQLLAIVIPLGIALIIAIGIFYLFVRRR